MTKIFKHYLTLPAPFKIFAHYLPKRALHHYVFKSLHYQSMINHFKVKILQSNFNPARPKILLQYLPSRARDHYTSKILQYQSMNDQLKFNQRRFSGPLRGDLRRGKLSG